MTEILTDEELATCKRRVWEKTQAQVTEAVEYALVEELRAGVRSDLRRLIHAEVRAMIKPKIEAKRKEIEARLDQLVTRMADISTGVIEQEVVDLVTKASEAVLMRVQETQRNLTYLVGQKIREKLRKQLEEER